MMSTSFQPILQSTISALIVLFHLYIITLTSGQTIIETPKYGGNGGNVGVTATPYINLGKIRGIASWGYDVTSWSGAIGEFSWIVGYPTQSNSATFGYQSPDTPCTPFQLSIHDYITGYRVITGPGPDVVFGITFYTHLNNTYQCQYPSLDMQNKIDSGIISHSGYYLSGFYMLSYAIVNQIGFQFTSASPSTPGKYKCFAL